RRARPGIAGLSPPAPRCRGDAFHGRWRGGRLPGGAGRPGCGGQVASRYGAGDAVRAGGAARPVSHRRWGSPGGPAGGPAPGGSGAAGRWRSGTVLAMLFERVVRPVLFRIGGGDPEAAHEWALRRLAALARRPAVLALLRNWYAVTAPVTVCGIEFPNPVG